MAQSPAPSPVPRKPLVARAADGSWTVTYSYKAPPAPAKGAPASGAPAHPPDLIASVRVEKTNGQYHVITTKSSGLRSEIWCMKGIEIYKGENSKNSARLSPDSPYYIDFSKTDFDELSWIGMDNYKGIKDGGVGAKFFIYDVKNVDRRATGQEKSTSGDLGVAVEKSGMVGADGDKKQAVSKLLAAQFGDTISHALVDVTTQLPTEYDDGHIDRTYAFSETPQLIPPDILKLFKEINEQTRKATVPAPPP